MKNDTHYSIINYSENVDLYEENDYTKGDGKETKYDTNLDLSTVKEGDLINKFHDDLTPKQCVKYHAKMYKIMHSTYGDLNRTDVIDGKIVSTEIINHKEQVIEVLKIKGVTTNVINNILKEANNYGYSGQQLQEIIENSIRKENVSRYDITNSKFKRISELERNIRKIIEGSKQYNRKTVKRRNKSNNTQELDNSSFSISKKVAKKIQIINLNL